MTTHEITTGEKGCGKSARHLLPINEQRQKHFATMESALYAAEQLCDKNCDRCERGLFRKGSVFPLKVKQVGVPSSCILRELRVLMGDHIVQHDIPYPVQDEGPIMPADKGQYLQERENLITRAKRFQETINNR